MNCRRGFMGALAAILGLSWSSRSDAKGGGGGGGGGKTLRLYRANGRYAGRIDPRGRFYGENGRYLGRVEGDRIYDAQGRYLGRYESSGRLHEDGGPHAGSGPADGLMRPAPAVPEDRKAPPTQPPGRSPPQPLIEIVRPPASAR